ncbi:50S ribosomal protein L11 methyltransferase [Desemzia incerta]|uniref:50S ribosomal protein L11 methyltransferase n=1 Tax=Desemzia incerta TaxID=82801 RepID=UPI0024C446FD|nr:50S ribosomal protein L11 methyltransferase [Desemzia incerta]WHZ31750.1 50S ribosomal protein L11 methyltransferase [Desemzia incerta]
MKWTEVSVHTSNEAIEAVSNIFIEAGSGGVAIENVQDFLSTPDDGFGEIRILENQDYVSEGSLVKAYFPETKNLMELIPEIKQRILALESYGLSIGPNTFSIEDVQEENWASAWKKYYHPQQITRYLTVAPQWEEYEPKMDGEIVIRLDPGLAFGTGTHATTRLSLQGLETYIRGGETILDVGTGSGVLSIASSALGAGEIHAFDLDEVAVRSAKENVKMNAYAQNVSVSANDLLKGIEIPADIVVANILAEIIVPLIPDAWRLLKPNGIFITSGIIEAKKELILSELETQGFTILQVLQMKDWFAIVAQKVEED